MLLSYQQKFAFSHCAFLPVERHTFPGLARGQYGGAFPPVHAGRAVLILEPAVPGFGRLPLKQFVGRPYPLTVGCEYFYTEGVQAYAYGAEFAGAIRAEFGRKSIGNEQVAKQIGL